MSRTKDEQFIVIAYEEASKTGDPFHVLNRYEIGRRCGITAKGVDAISKLLVRSNFIKHVGDTEMHLTDNGKRLAERLLGE